MNRLNNKTLGTLLVVLIVAYAATKIFSSSKDTNVQSELISIDTSLVTKIVLYPQKQNQKRLHLIRSGSGWHVVQGNKSVPANEGSMQSLLSAIAYVGIQRIVTRNKEDWNDYNMSDTAATHVQVFAKNRKLVDCWVSSSSKGTGPYTQTATYVRMDSLPAVYQTHGYLASVANKSFNDWRNHVFLKLDTKAITALQFRYPADSSFSVIKKDSVWMIGQQEADSAKIASYLNKLHSRHMYDFADTFKPRKDPRLLLSIKGTETTLVSAWYADSSWILQSSQRPDVYFYDKDSAAIKDLMVSKAMLLPDKK